VEFSLEFPRISLVFFWLDTKGGLLMNIMSLADCCRLLAIDPKTLRRWLHLAHLSVQTHPSDTRLKCVTSEQLQQLAVMHRRTLPELSEQLFPAEISARSTSSDVPTAAVWSSVVSEVSGSMTELTQQLGSLQTHVVALEHQLALLTEQWQQEQQWRTSVTKMLENNSLDKSAESSLDKSAESSLDKSAESSLDKPAESSLDKSAESSLDKVSASVSIDRRKHPHILPLVEYGAQGTYVVISPEQGRLSFEPDSPEWFAWLSTLPSFRFVGQHGRFTAFRGYQCTSHTSWWAHRQIHSHSHKRRLGLTASVTIECLELAASTLQALVP
jgi:hypothetical protein